MAAAFWGHDDDPPVAGETPCPGPCNRTFRVAEDKAATETRLAAAAEERDPDPAIVEHGVTIRPGRPVWCRDEHARNAAGEETDEVTHPAATKRIARDPHELPDLAERGKEYLAALSVCRTPQSLHQTRNGTTPVG